LQFRNFRGFVIPEIPNISGENSVNFGNETSVMSINGLTGCRSMLSTNEYVHVFAFDFSKAFDTAWHSALMSKLATICNYLTAFTTGCETFSPVDTIARDTPVICQPSLASKPL